MRLGTYLRAAWFAGCVKAGKAAWGAHEELLRREGLYADLYRKQLLEQEIAELG